MELNCEPAIGNNFETPAMADQGLALIDLAFQPIAMDEGAASILSAISDETRSSTEEGVSEALPAAILEQIRLLALPESASKEMRFIAANQCYSARACLMQSGESTASAGWIVLRLERNAHASDALAVLSTTCRLTQREKEALSALAIGLTSKEVAQRMNISPSTVKMFLRLIKIKTGARNRADIVARLLDPTDRSGHYQDDFGSRA